ncbi:hypothetical protein EJ07DRAFT_167099 [Lizonia empirigonia]|nr:hypothetical protein EJ07DRAFT_167099 [Lizonia empirigonia]
MGALTLQPTRYRKRDIASLTQDRFPDGLKAHRAASTPYTSFPVPTPHDTGPSQSVKIFTAAGRFLTEYWSRLMLVFVPIGLAAPYIGFNDSAVFVFNCFAIVPLAEVLCQATDSVASFMGETTGALVNVTMGNLTELVIFIQALVHRQYVIVRTSLIGSIVVNILLVLGLAILTGEGRERGQVYNVLATRVAAGLLCLTTVTLLVPSTVKLRKEDLATTHKMTNLSRAMSVVLIVVYFIYVWTQKIPVMMLMISTGLISICSENLVSRVDHFVTHSPISKTMVGLIILPIVGNAAELVSGIVFASRKQIDLAFAVSIGSAIQIALFVTPLIVLIGWGVDRDMSLHFTPFEPIALAASSVLFLMLVFENRCSVLKGVCLCAGYAVIA